MTAFGLYVVLNYSILIPVVTGAIRFRHIRSRFYPFILSLWLGLFNETLSLVMIYTIGTNAVSTNIYVLLEYLLLLLQFYQWNHIFKKACRIMAGFGLLVWLADHFVINTLNSDTSIFRLFYFLVIFFLSLAQINSIVNNEPRNLLKNPVFLVCSTFLTYYTCRTLIELINFFMPGESFLFNLSVFMILDVANLFSYIIYTIVILCIPGKQECIIQY